MSAVHKWTEEDIERLVRLIESGASFGEIVARIGCTETELEERASYLGLLLPKHEPVPVSTLTANSSRTPSEGSTIHFAPALVGRSRS